MEDRERSSTIAALLGQLAAPGAFAVRLQASADDLEIEVKGVGPLTLPVSLRAARSLVAAARPAPFGLRDQTLHDPTVRSTWEIAASRVKIGARRWKAALARHLKTLQAELGVPAECELRAELDKLLVYEKGQFFKAHQDSERSDDMVATLLVVLPSEHGGGTLCVEHRGERKIFSRLASQSTSLSLLAFYADCHHSVGKVSKGFRIALTYRLSIEDRAKYQAPSMPARLVDGLSEQLRTYFAAPIKERLSGTASTPQRWIYLLDHEYTQRSLGWERLKNGDRMRVAALQAATKRLDYEYYLALIEVHEIWQCQQDESYGWGRRESYHEEEDDEHGVQAISDSAMHRSIVVNRSVRHNLVDLIDSDVILTHWIDAHGEWVTGLPKETHDHEIHWTRRSAELHPFKSEYEGYQGNYGNTLDRWYHRAAFVTWPREQAFVLRAQGSPEWALERLLELSFADTSALTTRLTALLPHWPQMIQDVDGARFFAKVSRLAVRIEGSALAHAWLLPLGVHRLSSRAIRRDLAALVEKHGASWAQEIFRVWTQRRAWSAPDWRPLLADLCQELQACPSEACRELVAWLLDREVKAALDGLVADRGRFEAPWLDLESFSEASTRIAHVLEAARSVADAERIQETILWLLEGESKLEPSCLLQILRACRARSPELRTQVDDSRLRQACVTYLESMLSAPLRGPNDWAIEYRIRCSCEDCETLSRFVQSPSEALDWPLAKQRRRHIHDAIGSAKLPLSHTTLHRGSPHVLQLRKQASLLALEREYREQLRATLRELGPAAPRVRGRRVSRI